MIEAYIMYKENPRRLYMQSMKEVEAIYDNMIMNELFLKYNKSMPKRLEKIAIGASILLFH